MSVFAFQFGADPEIFVKKNGKGVSAHGMVPGTKSEPYKTEFGAIQVDGMALEFNIDPTPMNDFDGFNRNIVRTIRTLKEAAGEGVSMAVQPVMEFDEKYMAEQPDEAKELGCDPDFNAYTRQPNPRPDGDRPFRTGSGHVHIGWGADIPTDNEEHIQICANFIKMLDATCGLFMTIIDRDPRRRELYGKAGAFRPKSYGVEYRTPSNVWLKNIYRRRVMHGLMQQAIRLMQRGSTVATVLGISEDELQRIINEGDVDIAKHLFEPRLPWTIKNDYDRVLGESEFAKAA